MRGSDPPLCSIHAGRPRQPAAGKSVGAPPGNDNGLLHGFYSRFLRDANGHPIEGADGTRLEGEIAITRIALHRALTMLVTGSTLGHRPRPLDAADVARLIGLAFEGARTISRLLEARYNMGGESESMAFMDEVLDQLSEEWGVPL